MLISGFRSELKILEDRPRDHATALPRAGALSESGPCQETFFLISGTSKFSSKLPELPEGVEAPDFSNGQANGMPGNNGPMGGKPGDMNNGRAPGMIDFDAMATNSVISSETLEKIKAFMEANKPEGQPEMNGQAPEMNGEAPDLTGEAPELGTDLLDDLLKNEIITQAEYDALVAAQAATQTTESTEE